MEVFGVSSSWQSLLWPFESFLFFREAYWWLRQNTPEDAKIMSWWDYGYQISSMANRTILVDNNTWNNTHISRVGQAMASDEEHAYEIMRELDVDYVLVIFGGLISYSWGLVNNSFLLSWFFTNWKQCKNVGYQIRTIKVFVICFIGVPGHPLLAQHTCQCPCISVVLEATLKASQGPLKNALSAQKALQGFKTETRKLLAGTEEKSISRTRNYWFDLRQINEFSQKGNKILR